MRIAAIYNVWNDWDLLELSIDNIFQLVDDVIVIYSRKSNYGENSDPPINIAFPGNVELFQREPIHFSPIYSETDKRNYGLSIAEKKGCTHFLIMDADEFYEPKDFHKAKEYLHYTGLNGLVVESYVYFKKPTLTIGKDITLVPFIHKITPNLKHEFNRNYPFAWQGEQIRIDPTRSLNINSGVEMFDCPMHHYSWVRKDYAKKIRNSTAKANLSRSTIVQDLLDAKEGYFVQFYGKRLLRVANRFGIPDYGELANEDLQLQ